MATLLATLFLGAGCRLPWAREGRDEVNVAFQLQNNQPVIETRVEGHPARLIVSTASRRSILTEDFRKRASIRRRPLLFFGPSTAFRYTPLIVTDDLQIADGFIGADVFARSELSIDYVRQLISVRHSQKNPPKSVFFRFADLPSIPVRINGQKSIALIDTTVPDTFWVPGNLAGAAAGSRATIQLGIAAEPVAAVDVRVVAAGEPVRVGVRFLADYLTIIDFRQKTVVLLPHPFLKSGRPANPQP